MSLKPSASREALDRKVRDQRLLLCLYGLGTNAGLKHVAAGVPGTSYDELLHIRRRYIDPSSLRAAAAKVADATLEVRNPTVWGDAGTACAADSTKFGTWDRNLMTEWHARYGGHWGFLSFTCSAVRNAWAFQTTEAGRPAHWRKGKQTPTASRKEGHK